MCNLCKKMSSTPQLPCPSFLRGGFLFLSFSFIIESWISYKRSLQIIMKKLNIQLILVIPLWKISIGSADFTPNKFVIYQAFHSNLLYYVIFLKSQKTNQFHYICISNFFHTKITPQSIPERHPISILYNFKHFLWHRFLFLRLNLRLCLPKRFHPFWCFLCIESDMRVHIHCDRYIRMSHINEKYVKASLERLSIY